MRIAITGATGNIGTSLVRALREDPAVDSIVGIARRKPSLQWRKVTWAAADISSSDLTSLFAGADAVVHLAWLIQPSRDLATTRKTNVDGSARVFKAAAEAGVRTLVYASSIGAYSPGPKDRTVDESWPAGGVPTSFYSRHKAEVEGLLDSFEIEHPSLRVVRLRPGLSFKRESATGIRRVFAGPLLPTFLLRKSLIPIVPDVPGLRVQGVHSDDVAEAYRLALLSDVRGAFNIVADPVLDASSVGSLLGARTVKVSPKGLRIFVNLTWRMHLQPTPDGWLDMGLQVPLLDGARARDELGWVPAHRADDALLEVMTGMRERAGLDTPPLSPESSGPARVKELRTSVGGRST
ncbi:MAG: NAD-dependent epimerase/dehydratase family protein [Actinobacteria bacterium]|nr:NAD-dependent epimerase/dehydratase family protein [Actinomycetota bacterium]